MVELPQGGRLAVPGLLLEVQHIAKLAEASALLTQALPVNGGVKFDRIPQWPDRAKQYRVLLCGVLRTG